MVAARVQAFGGMVPAVDDRLLPDSAATLARDAWLYSGALIGLPTPRLLRNCVLPEVGKVYRIPTNYTNSTYLFNSTWLEFQNADTDVIRAPVFDDTHDRYYWASSTQSPKYNTRARIDSGDDPFLLGVPTPVGAPPVVVTGGSGTTVARAYVVTWVSAYGEEGAPSSPSLVTGFINGSWDVTLPVADAGDLGVDRNLTKVRIYRTITSSGGVATFFLVVELDIDETDYSDTLADTVVSANNQLESFAWTPPPDDLQGFSMMPNGIVAGWRNNELWFSEPYRPHAWPVSHVQTVEYPIVGLGIAANQALVACTQGFPVIAVGSTPEGITVNKLTLFEPCTARGSILSAPEGVYYASPNGLILVQAQAQNITKNLITKDKWQQFTGRQRLKAARIGTAYYGFGSVVPGVFEPTAFDDGAFTSQDFSDAYVGVLIDPLTERVALSLLSSEQAVYGVQNDVWSGELFILRDGNVYWLDQATPTILTEPATWVSKKFQTSSPRNFGATKIYFEVPDGTGALNPVRNTNLVQDLAADQYALVKWYADGNHIATHELRKSGELLRLPSDRKYDFLWFELDTRVRILSVHIASTAKELRNV